MRLFSSNIKYGVMIPMFVLLSCKKLVEIDQPIDQVVTEKVYSNDELATAAIRGIYAKMINGAAFASGSRYSITFLAGRSADDFINQSNVDNTNQFSLNSISATNTILRTNLWQEPYQVIYAANSVIENLDRSTAVNEKLKVQLTAEAKFIRAFCHFYLTNLFGEIPVILTTDYRLNAVSSASSKVQIYNAMIKDLSEAKTNLNINYPSADRIRVNKWVASAFLARVYLYNSQWALAENESAEVIGQHSIYKLSNDLNKVFLRTSEETILQFATTANATYNTSEGLLFILDATPTNTTEVTLSKGIIDAFESGDQRYNKWVGTFSSGLSTWPYPLKYKIKSGGSPMNEYSVVLRLAEQLLIHAEACINQPGKIVQGIQDLNILRTRARALPNATSPDPLPELPLTLTKEEALHAVEQERRIELFSEWGHRWLDLKRTGKANAILGPLKAPNWQPTDVLFPIPASEIINDPNLKQNEGYTF